MTITAEEVLALVLDWLRKHGPDLLERMFDDIPSAKIILSGPSAAEKKLEELSKEP